MAAQRALFAGRLFERHFNPSCHLSQHRFSRKLRVRFLSERFVDNSDTEPPIPEYKAPENETLERKRARLLYQSRKRGMLENGLLLSTFADKYLDCLSESLLDDYDKLINQPSNDWEIYYWMTEKKVTPEEYNSEIMDMLKNHAKNKDMEERIRQPDLKEK